MCYSVQLASIFMFFASYVHHGYCPVIFFLCSIICLWYQSNFGLKISLEVFPLLHYFGKNFRRIGVNYLNVWWNLPGKPCGPTHFFFGCFLITDSIFLLVTGLFVFSIHDLVSAGYMFPGIFLVLGYPVYWIFVHSSLL